MGVPKGEKTGKRTNNFKEIVENIPNLMKYMNINIKKTQLISSRMNSKTHHTKTHYNRTAKGKKENLENSKREATHQT